MMEEYNALQYPEGVGHMAKELLTFLPDDQNVRELFMTDLLLWLIQF